MTATVAQVPDRARRVRSGNAYLVEMAAGVVAFDSL